jgi:hypothetical protein
MKLTQEQLEAIRQRAENATPGPWETCEISKLSHAKWFGVLGGDSDDSLIDIGVDTLNENDATFIAHARTDIPALLDHIAELEAELEKYRKILHGELRIVVKKNDVPIFDLDGVTLNVEKPVKEDDQ